MLPKHVSLEGGLGGIFLATDVATEFSGQDVFNKLKAALLFCCVVGSMCPLGIYQLAPHIRAPLQLHSTWLQRCRSIGVSAGSFIDGL